MHKELLTVEVAFWQQRTKSQLLKECDRNTRFFHGTSTKHHHRNKILAIQNIDGEWKSKPKHIRRIFIKYYKDLFKSNNLKSISDDFRFRTTINPRDIVGLCHIPSNEEIDGDIKSMGPTKAPGLDGLPLIFFQSG